MAQAPESVELPGIPDLAQMIEQYRLLVLQTGGSQEAVGKEQAAYGSAQAIANQKVMEDARLASQEFVGKAQIEINRAAANARSQAEIGANPDAQSYVLGKLSDLYLRGQQEVMQSAETLQQKMTLGFSDNPLEWIVQQFTLPREVHAHNVKVQQQEVIDGTMKKIQDTSNAAIALNAARQATTTLELADIAGQRALTTAEKIVADNQKELAKINMGVIGLQHGMDQNVFQASVAMNKVSSDAEQLKIQQEHLSIARRNAANSEERLRMEQEEQGRRKITWDRLQANELSMQQALDRATQTHGMMPMTVEQFRTMSGKMRDQLQHAMTDPNVQQGRLAATPYLSVQAIEQLNSPLNAEQLHVKAALVKIAEEAINSPEGGGAAMWPTKKPEEKQRIIDNYIKTQTNIQLKNIPDEGSMFSAPPMNTVGQMPSVAKTEFWQRYFAKQSESKYVPLRAQAVFDQAVQAVVKGEMSLDQVSTEAASVYETIGAENRHKRAYNKFSMQLDPKYLNGYNTRIALPNANILGESQVIDVSNKQEFMNHVMRAVNHIRTQQVLDIYEASGGRFSAPRPGSP